MLTPYDEFPVHQSSRPFSMVPSTDYGWDDGYYFGLMNPVDRQFLDVNFRVNPNTDMVGGAALLVVDDHQFVVRTNRCWRRDFDLRIGPLRLENLEPMRQWRLVLEENDSGLAFDVLWQAATPPILEAHHYVEQRGRVTTDQSRYNQPGRGSGWISFRGRTIDVTPERWGAARDHSWGLYVQRPPFAPDPSHLPPTPPRSRPRALRFWTIFSFPDGGPGGFFQANELSDGSQAGMTDVFSSPFEGRIHLGPDDEGVDLATYEHDMTFEPGTRLLRTASFRLTDAAGATWEVDFERAMMPWSPRTLGYSVGSWRDGGNFHSFHGSEELAIEWDEPVDISVQPMPPLANVPVAPGEDRFRMRADAGKPETGTVLTCHVVLRSPGGRRYDGGTCHVDCSVLGPYPRYGITEATP
ncbi:hypothetical protein [Streptomyces brasiliensis]|uniref:Uncharacterized protein n=1 Tax=Streptomyces brasiliensis TaxID=1954 RepID=A0A917NYR0_9ACTN|nr:hypothetical protein [Streptomyces brasiliensis]GGJ41344.1 hypothetical protein GCM10010121_060470 [Streptomyces brasiliensis]